MPVLVLTACARIVRSIVFFNLLTGGTLLGSLVQDSLGGFGSARRPTTLLRVVAVLLTFGGTILTQSADTAKKTKSEAAAAVGSGSTHQLNS